MNAYVVTIYILKEAEIRWLSWMKDEHIPEVLATGLFKDCRMCRSETEHRSGCTTYRMYYELKSRAAFDSYENDFAPKLRERALDEFSGLFTAERDLIKTVEYFSA